MEAIEVGSGELTVIAISVLLTIGQTARAQQPWRDGLGVARERGNASVARFIRGSIAFAAYQEGDWDEALAARWPTSSRRPKRASDRARNR